jgi:hypothetical protein
MQRESAHPSLPQVADLQGPMPRRARPGLHLPQFVAIDSFGGYSQVGNYLGLAAMVAFAAWAWWWGDRHESPPSEVDRERGDIR